MKPIKVLMTLLTLLALGLVACEGDGDAYTLTLTVMGNGSVMSEPGGIDCSSNTTCTADFESGTRLSLKAVAGADVAFAGWRGACTSPSGCTLTVDKDKAVTATFSSPTAPTTPDPDPDPTVPNPVPDPSTPDPSEPPPSPGDDPTESDPAEPDPTAPDPAVNSVTVTPETAFVVVNATVQLNATVDAEEGADPTVTWSSSNDIIATVDENGVVTGVVEGFATITATSDADPTKLDSAEVTVVSSEP